MAFDAVVAEDMPASHCMRHRGPLSAQATLLPQPLLFLPSLPSGPFSPKHKWRHRCFQFPRIDQRQQEDEELSEAVPHQLPVHVLVVYVPVHTGLAENRLSSRDPFSQDRMATFPQEHEEVEETCKLGDARNKCQASTETLLEETIVSSRPSWSQTQTQQQAMGAVLEPAGAGGEQGQTQLLPAGQRTVTGGGGQSAVVVQAE